MAERFLDQLAEIPEHELSRDDFCAICHSEYGTNPADIAVRLPCNHHVGLECISTWLSQDLNNSCPMCRRVFFDVIGVIDEVGEEEQYHREILRRVQRPPQERHAQEDTPEWGHTWYSYFLEAAAEQYQESLTRARAFYARRYDNYEGFHIDYQAMAFRTLPIREFLLYVQFRRDWGLPPMAGPIREPLNAEQLEELFQELRRRGSFDLEVHGYPRYEGLTDRQIWQLRREEGECYSVWEGGYWSLGLV